MIVPVFYTDTGKLDVLQVEGGETMPEIKTRIITGAHFRFMMSNYVSTDTVLSDEAFDKIANGMQAAVNLLPEEEQTLSNFLAASRLLRFIENKDLVK